MASSEAATDTRYAQKAERFAAIVRELRRRSGDTLQSLGDRSGLAPSTISKIENAQLSPSYETILRLADGLNVDLAALFDSSTSLPAMSGRRSITRSDQGSRYSSPQYDYELLCPDLARKQFIPLRATINAHDIRDFPELTRHDGEEFIYVLSGVVELHTDHYEPTRLEAGDSCYFDSTIGHACTSVGKTEAEILWISSRAAEPAIGTAQRPA